ncbi:MAG TPA: patatin-like phospholipase family protein [Pyrinomonadaceae bacterium]
MAQEGNVRSNDASKRVHLVLSAGGMKCISYAGAVAELEKNGFEFASVSGSSAGSLIGAILCSKVRLQGFQQAVNSLDFSSLGEDRSWLPFRKPFARYKKSLVAERFREIVGDNPKFRDMNPPFATFSVDLRTHKIHVYSTQATPDIAVADALSASTAAPFLFPAQSVKGNLLLDGAVVSQSPIWLATAQNDELPILVLRPQKDVARPAPTGPIEYLTSIIDVAGGSRDLYLIDQMPRVRLIEIDCDEVRFDQFDLSLEERESLVRSGHVAIERDLKDLLRSEPVPKRPVKARAVQNNPEKAGEDAFISIVNALPVKRDQVFISYSHEDKEWLHRLQDALQPYARNNSLNLWSDTKINAGDNWRAEIRKALAAAKVAVLLVTIDYLASEFINDTELPEFIRASEKEGLTILWVLVGPCAYEETELVNFQAVNNLERPLKQMLEEGKESEVEAELVKICREISKALASAKAGP